MNNWILCVNFWAEISFFRFLTRDNPGSFEIQQFHAIQVCDQLRNGSFIKWNDQNESKMNISVERKPISYQCFEFHFIFIHKYLLMINIITMIQISKWISFMNIQEYKRKMFARIKSAFRTWDDAFERFIDNFIYSCEKRIDRFQSFGVKWNQKSTINRFPINYQTFTDWLFSFAQKDFHVEKINISLSCSNLFEIVLIVWFDFA